MATCEERVKGWMAVDKQELWGSSSPFDLVEGGKEKMVKELLAVTSDVKHFPKDDSPYTDPSWPVDSRHNRYSRRSTSRCSACSYR